MMAAESTESGGAAMLPRARRGLDVVFFAVLFPACFAVLLWMETGGGYRT
jgi:hypothetical protein